MGNAQNFFARDDKGRRSEYTIVKKYGSKTINGIKGSVIKRIGDSDTHTNLPYYSNTSDIYFRMNKNGICQARVYIGQKKYLDFDWSHNHTNKDSKRKFSIGTVHVQVWKETTNGSFSRMSDNARGMNNAEIKKYGPILKEFCPNIKLR